MKFIEIEELNATNPNYYDMGELNEFELVECFGTPEQLEQMIEEAHNWFEMVENDQIESHMYDLEPPNNWAD